MPGLRIGYVVADLLRHQATGKAELLANELGRIKSFVFLNHFTCSSGYGWGAVSQGRFFVIHFE